MLLYVMRLGPAEDQSASGRDSDRALTHAGRLRVRAVAKLLLEHGEVPSAILSSPLARALQTAEIVASVIDHDGHDGGWVETRRELEPGQLAIRIVREWALQARKPPHDRLLVVGHEPDLSTLVSMLCGQALPSTSFQKGMVVGLIASPPDRSATQREMVMRFVVDPKLLVFSPVTGGTNP